jgi:hypothetical protein
MVAKSKADGHEILWDESKGWIYVDNGESADVRPCNHCGKKPIGVMVKIPADLSHTGQEQWKYAQIDACIAPIVKALQEGGIDMRGSCCGHDSGIGDIHLQDGRAILILDEKRATKYYCR